MVQLHYLQLFLRKTGLKNLGPMVPGCLSVYIHRLFIHKLTDTFPGKFASVS